MAFLALGGLLLNLVCRQINLDLAISDKNEGNFREKETFQWISNSNSVYRGLYSLRLTSQIVPCCYVILLQSLIELLKGHSKFVSEA